MSVLPEVHDAAEASGLVRELFRDPPPAALALAMAGDAGDADAALRWLLVALRDLPPAQAALLRAGAARLLGEPALSGYLICLLEDGDPETGTEVSDAVARVASAGGLRGVPATSVGGPDVHALVLGLCARLNVAPSQPALERDLTDARYRDLALLLAATADPETVVATLPAAVSGIDPADEYAIEALGRALREVLQRHGEGIAFALFDAPGGDAPTLAAGMREALAPARSGWLTAAQRERELEALRRQLCKEPNNAYLRLRLDSTARDAFLKATGAQYHRTTFAP